MPDTDGYNLPRHSDESDRLEQQHEAYVSIIGFQLHPRIQKALPKDARIADVGTGTGIWLRTLADQSYASRDWTYTGLDISSAQFPKPPGQQPSSSDRYTYDLLDITSPIPAKYHATFDLVHLRLLVCGLTFPQWPTAARNILALLKPGGWLQWQESELEHIRVYQSVVGASTAANERLIGAIIPPLQAQGKVAGDVTRLVEHVSGAGFEGARQEVFSTEGRREVREKLMGVQIRAEEALARALVGREGFGIGEGELEGVLRAAKEELEGGMAYLQFGMRVVTARRPE